MGLDLASLFENEGGGEGFWGNGEEDGEDILLDEVKERDGSEMKPCFIMFDTSLDLSAAIGASN